jgi:hypothetical protein
MKGSKNMSFHIDKDAFSNGQIGSKLWLCEEIEKLFSSMDCVWIYGGWYGLSAFLLRSRNNLEIGRIASYDIDPSCKPIADMINENWVYNDWQFKAFTEDCNTLEPTRGNPDLIINTSTEHFETLDWWNNIPEGIVVALQGNNMPHDDHVVHTETLTQFLEQYKFKEILFSGEKTFKYPDWEFTRFMTIGIK